MSIKPNNIKKKLIQKLKHQKIVWRRKIGKINQEDTLMKKIKNLLLRILMTSLLFEEIIKKEEKNEKKMRSKQKRKSLINQTLLIINNLI